MNTTKTVLPLQYMVVMYSSIKLKFNIILSICKHFANNLGLHILNCRLSEGPVQGSPFITHLGDGDPNLQPHPQYLYRSSTPEEEQTLQLVIPGLDQSGSGENSLNNSGGNKEENTSGTTKMSLPLLILLVPGPKGPRYLMPSFGDYYGKLLEKLSRNLQRSFLKVYHNMNDVIHILSKIWQVLE